MTRTVIVTGGSSGLGLFISKSFASIGDRVIIVARNEAKLKASTLSLQSLGLDVSFRRLDVTDAFKVKSVFEEVNNTYGAIDVLVNCAGVLGPAGRLDTVEIDDWVANINSNLIGPALTMREAIKHMLFKGAGKIVNISGGGAVKALPTLSAYCASKAGLIRLTETVAAEFFDRNIQVNAVAPGFIVSGIHDQIINTSSNLDRNLRNELIEKISTGGDSPYPTCDLCLFLTSQESNHITGRLISAIHDKWQEFKSHDFKQSALYTLKRVDNHFVFDVTE